MNIFEALSFGLTVGIYGGIIILIIKTNKILERVTYNTFSLSDIGKKLPEK